MGRVAAAAAATRRTPPSRTPADRGCKNGRAVLLAPGILSPRKLTVKGAPCGRVAPRRPLR